MLMITVQVHGLGRQTCRPGLFSHSTFFGGGGGYTGLRIVLCHTLNTVCSIWSVVWTVFIEPCKSACLVCSFKSGQELGTPLCCVTKVEVEDWNHETHQVHGISSAGTWWRQEPSLYILSHTRPARLLVLFLFLLHKPRPTAPFTTAPSASQLSCLPFVFLFACVRSINFMFLLFLPLGEVSGKPGWTLSTFCEQNNLGLAQLGTQFLVRKCEF